MKNGSKKISILIILLFLITTVTGCWDNKEVTELSFVVAVGLDKVDNNKIEFTVQLSKCSAMQRSSSGEEKKFWLYSSIGDTVFEAIRNQATTLNRKIFISHLQLIIIGEELAKEGLLEVLDFFERDHEMNPLANVLIARGTTAKEVLQVKSELEDLPVMHIIEIIENYASLAKTKKSIMFDLLSDLGSPGKESVIGIIIPQDKQQKIMSRVKDFKIEGASVFRADELIGWLDAIQTRGYMFVINKVQSTILNVPNPIEKDKKVAIEVVQSNAKMDVEFRDEQMNLSIEIKQEGKIGDQQGVGNLTTAEMIKILEEETAKVTEKEIRNVIELAQKEYQVDMFGFGEIVYRKYYDYWKKVEDHWNAEFSQAFVDIKVKSYIRRSGLIKAPTTPRE